MEYICLSNRPLTLQIHHWLPVVRRLSMVSGCEESPGFGQQLCQRTTTGYLWSTMECSQPVAWTSHWSLPIVSNIKAFHERSTISGLTLPRTVHLDDTMCDTVSSVSLLCAHKVLPKCYQPLQALSCIFTNHLHLCRHLVVVVVELPQAPEDDPQKR